MPRIMLYRDRLAAERKRFAAREGRMGYGIGLVLAEKDGVRIEVAIREHRGILLADIDLGREGGVPRRERLHVIKMPVGDEDRTGRDKISTKSGSRLLDADEGINEEGLPPIRYVIGIRAEGSRREGENTAHTLLPPKIQFAFYILPLK